MVNLYCTITLGLLTATLWYALLNKAAEQQKQLYLRSSAHSLCGGEEFSDYDPAYCSPLNSHVFPEFICCKEMSRLTRALLASNQEHRCCLHRSPAESESER